MEEMQVKRKTWYDKNAVKREFKDGDLVLVLATSRANKLAVQWIGPGTILNKISETNYLVEIPGRRETSQIYHINMLKPYYKRPEHINVIINDETKNSLADQELEIPYLENNSLIYDFEDVIQASELNKHLHDKQMDRLRELLNKYSKCFSNNPGLTNLVEHEIQLVSDQPVRTKPYRMSHRQNEILKNEINRMLKLGIIEVGESDYMSPMILVEIAGKEPRPCIDYRKLNGIIRTEYFPLPNIEERVEKVSAAKFITVFDLSKGYWQIPLSKTAQRYAAFCTSFGTYRPLRMSFGLKNAPYFFSKLMAELLNGLEDFVVPYLDDIAIFSDTWESHIKHMETVLQRIKRAKLTIKPSKCKFAQQNVKFLGHIVGQGFRTPSEIKVQAVLEFPTPRTKTQIRAFLGIAGYYQKYINLFSVIAAPLTDALKGRAKKGEIKWTTECENAFRELKGKLIDKPVLYAPNFEREFIVQTDASNAGMGAVLTQLTEQGEEHPIVYLSKKFSEVEKRYCTTEKECASIVFAIKRLHYYLDGNSFLVMTDHNPLVWLNRNVSSNPRLMRWALALQPYNFRIVHRSDSTPTRAISDPAQPLFDPPEESSDPTGRIRYRYSFKRYTIQPEVRFIAKQSSLMKIGNNGNLVLGPFDESTPCLMIVLMNCQTKLRINHLTAVKSVAILENENISLLRMNKTRKTPGGLDCPIVLPDEFIAVDDKNVCAPRIMADKDIFELVQKLKIIIDAVSDDENEINNASPCSHIIRNEERHEKPSSLFTPHFAKGNAVTPSAAVRVEKGAQTHETPQIYPPLPQKSRNYEGYKKILWGSP
ncbi:retrovirus-related Pol polyprotein from transposon 297 [Trichonephila clavipes]|uniref:RNA-directed DNA polymerase n=1 Tax=Trichonephila clavipes TaxID=2585209 RepID=A0A8X6RSI8_TRICX|nr:retrovirus-related Pol polyprotein from transposon 297 [Trichonephila clavipes]